MIRIEDLRKRGVKEGVKKFKVGQTVRVHKRIIDEKKKERVQVFEGLIINVRNENSISYTITIRKVINGYGVEQVIQVHSPLIKEVELKKEAKVRRAKLYFIRKLTGRAAKLKERFINT